jgi:hypothetical protein
VLKKSPSGSISPYYFMGGELQPLNYGSYHEDKKKLFDVMKAEEEFILRSPGQNNRRVWIDLYETTLDDEVINALAQHIGNISGKLYKLCLVGCSWLNRRKIKKRFVQSGLDFGTRFKFFSDPEDAKRWLVKEPS